MHPVVSEASDLVKDLLFAELPGSVRSQVEFLASDQPSGALYDNLKLVCPYLRAVYLDEVRLLHCLERCFLANVFSWSESLAEGPSQVQPSGHAHTGRALGLPVHKAHGCCVFAS